MSSMPPAARSMSRAVRLEVLARDELVTRHFDRAAIERLTNPANYLGMAPQMVDRVLASSAASSRQLDTKS
jgi:3-carboxy-cis,cis-muconate cycloisomerase